MHCMLQLYQPLNVYLCYRRSSQAARNFQPKLDIFVLLHLFRLIVLMTDRVEFKTALV